MNANFLTVEIMCKPLVKLFLENNFGEPVTFPKEHTLYKLACAQLFKANTRSNVTKEYTECFNLNISEKNFKYDGFNINEENTRNFNNGVDYYIKSLCRTNLDSLLSLNARQTDWKRKFIDILNSNIVTNRTEKEVTKIKKELVNELADHEFTIKKAIEHVVCVSLKLNLEVLKYDAVKQDYFRYRRNKFGTQLSPT